MRSLLPGSLVLVVLAGCGGEAARSAEPAEAPVERANADPEREPPSASGSASGETGRARPPKLDGFTVQLAHHARGSDLAIVPGKPHALVGGRALSLIDVPTGTLRAHWVLDSVVGLDVAPDASAALVLVQPDPFVWSGVEDFSAPRRAVLLDLHSGTTRTVFDDDADYANRSMISAALHPAGSHVALVRETQEEGVGSVAVTGLGRAPRWRASDLQAVAYSANGEHLVGHARSGVEVLHPTRGRRLHRIELATVTGVALHPTEGVAAVVAQDEVVVIDLDAGTVRSRAEARGASSVAWSPDGTRLGVCAGSVHVFALAELRPVEVPEVACAWTPPDLRGRVAAMGREGWSDGTHQVDVEEAVRVATDPARPSWTLVSDFQGVSILNHTRHRLRRISRRGAHSEGRIRGARITQEAGAPPALEVQLVGERTRLGPPAPDVGFPAPGIVPAPELTASSPDGRRRVIISVDEDEIPTAVLLVAGAEAPVSLDVGQQEMGCSYDDYDGERTCYAPVTFFEGGLMIDVDRHRVFQDDGTLRGVLPAYTRGFADPRGERFVIYDTSSHAVHLATSDFERGTRWFAPHEGSVEVAFAPERGPMAATRGASLVLADAAGEVQFRVALPGVAIDLAFESASRLRVRTAGELIWVNPATGEFTARRPQQAVAVTPSGSHALFREGGAMRMQSLRGEAAPVDLGACPYLGWPAGATDSVFWWTRDGRLELVRIADGERLHVRALGPVVVAYDDRGRVQMSDPSRLSILRTRVGASLLDAEIAPLEPERLDPNLVTQFLAGA